MATAGHRVRVGVGVGVGVGRDVDVDVDASERREGHAVGGAARWTRKDARMAEWSGDDATTVRFARLARASAIGSP